MVPGEFPAGHYRSGELKAEPHLPPGLQDCRLSSKMRMRYVMRYVTAREYSRAKPRLHPGFKEW